MTQSKVNNGYLRTATLSTQVLLVSVSLISPVNSVETGNKFKAQYATSILGLYDISTFDIYKDRQKIHIFAGGRLSKSDPALVLRYKRSTDGGYSWTNPVTIRTNGQLPEINAKRGNDIQLAAKGDQLVALMQGKSELPAMGPMICLYSTDSGESWQLGSNPAKDNDGSQAYIDLMADKTGIFHAVWLEDPEENGYQSLRYARSDDGGKSWSQLKTIEDSTCSCCWNTIVSSPLNHLNVLYRNMVPRDMALIQSIDAGTTWQQLGAVGDFEWQLKGCPHVGGSANYASSEDTQWLHSLVWTGTLEKAGLYHLASSDHGSTWSEPKQLSNTGINGDIAHNGSHIVAAWNELEAAGMSVVYAMTTDNGATWSKPVRLAQADNAATQPRLVSTEDGILAVWTEKPAKQASRLAWKIIETKTTHHIKREETM
ncbi:exo-alpha-sialidase [Nitrosomonas sp.]|uniref:exo-alpha-sialidase n=1 Tax=Nitrosomonas sp. TaxID=42353 RepID=UPI001D4A2B1F|nr:exo-alpha-sialidase [Nitrosomonas sp.]MCB1949479.1 exo-alpha-sialidase [Nitrosomonas sp.]